jgi:hypothetical protein
MGLDALETSISSQPLAAQMGVNPAGRNIGTTWGLKPRLQTHVRISGYSSAATSIEHGHNLTMALLILTSRSLASILPMGIMPTFLPDFPFQVRKLWARDLRPGTLARTRGFVCTLKFHCTVTRLI